MRQQHGRLWLEFLPAYAPELNPVEYLWSHWKQHKLPNFRPTTFGAAEPLRSQGPSSRTQKTDPSHCLLAAGGPVSFVTILCNSQ